MSVKAMLTETTDIVNRLFFSAYNNSNKIKKYLIINTIHFIIK